MPELATHSLVGYIVAKSARKSELVLIVLIGAVLPDVLTRIPSIILELFGRPWAKYAEFFGPLHSPFPLLLMCLLICQFFAAEIRKAVFFSLSVGVGTHLFLDILQRTIAGMGFQKVPLGGYLWFFPFSWYDFQIGLFWPEGSLYAIPVLAALAFILLVSVKAAGNRE